MNIDTITKHLTIHNLLRKRLNKADIIFEKHTNPPEKWVAEYERLNKKFLDNIDVLQNILGKDKSFDPTRDWDYIDFLEYQNQGIYNLN